MVRGPCCEKMGLNKGPWTPDEDRILISYIRNNGHPNWRALPKLAGLLRCGKSCRLRWTNYLRPDIKRGNFTTQEEDTIIHLHHILGNRWSAIAARLPGRTDNEIKNVWHTHLKKKLKDYEPPHNSKPPSSESSNNNSEFSAATNSPQSEITLVDDLQVVLKQDRMEPSECRFLMENDCTTHHAAHQLPFSSVDMCATEDDMDYWYNLFINDGDVSELSEF